MGDFSKKAEAIGALVERKQVEYGDAYGRAGQVIAVLYPDGIRPDQYGDALGVVRVLDKLFRIAQRGKSGVDLGKESPWDDIAGYGVLGAVKDDRQKEARERGG